MKIIRLCTTSNLTFIVGLPFMLTACSYFNPAYHPPDVTISKSWQGVAVAQKTVDLPYLQWWRDYNDAKLNQVVQQALIHNYDIAIAAKNIELAQSQLNIIALNWLPGVGLLAGFTHGNTGFNLNGFNLPSDGGAMGFLGILPQYTINLFTNYSRYQQAKHELSATEADYLSMRLAVISQMVTAYFNALFEQEQLSLLEALYQFLDKQVMLNQNMLKQGFGNVIVLDQLRAQLTQAKGQIKLQQQNVLVAKNAIHYLLGQVPGKMELSESFTQLVVSKSIPGNLPVSVLATRPDLIAAEERLKAVNQSTATASSSLLPTISLNALFTKQHFSTDSLKGSSNINAQSVDAAMMISPQTFGVIAQTKVNYSMVQLQYINVVNEALHDVQNKLLLYQGMRDKYDNNFRALENLRESLQKQQALFQQGIISELTLLNAQMEYVAAKMVVAQTKFEMLVANIKLYQALGGGYLYDIHNMAMVDGVLENAQKTD